MIIKIFSVLEAYCILVAATDNHSWLNRRVLKKLNLGKVVVNNARHETSRNRTGDLQIFSIALSRLSCHLNDWANRGGSEHWLDNQISDELKMKDNEIFLSFKSILDTNCRDR